MRRLAPCRARAQLGLFVIATLAVGLLAPSGAVAAEKAIWGPVTTSTGRDALPTYGRLGVDTFQIQLRWDRTARSRPASPRDHNDPAYKWPEDVDKAVAEAGDYGVRVAILVQQSPRWANGGRESNWAPNDDGDYADFLHAAARRYPSVRRWMIWGEPSREAHFAPMPKDSPIGPRRYARLLDAAYVALKRESRQNIVIGGMTFPGGAQDVMPEDFVRWMRLDDGNGPPPRLDWFGHNAFTAAPPRLSFRAPPYRGRPFNDIPTFYRELRRAYRSTGSAPRLWLSEFTVQSDNNSNIFDFHVSRAEQARWISSAYRIANQHDWIAGLGWFSLQDRGDGPNDAKWGLYDYDFQYKPSAVAFYRAPAQRLRPLMALRQLTSRARLRRGELLFVYPRISERMLVTLRDRRGRAVFSQIVQGRERRLLRLRLRTTSARRGLYTLEVRSSQRAPEATRRVLVR